MTSYSERLRAQLTADERSVFARLNSPHKVQDFVDRVPVNLEETGETILSPRRVLRENRAHCIEGALFAAACFAYHGHPALILNFQASAIDVDHVSCTRSSGQTICKRYSRCISTAAALAVVVVMK